jgi:hypothetical protein
MPTNPLTGNKRKRTKFETARNKRSQALDATDSMILCKIQDTIYKYYELLFQSSFYILLLIFCLEMDALDDEISLMALQFFTAAFRYYFDCIHILLLQDSRIADITPGEELGRGHNLKPRFFCMINDFDSDDEAITATNFDKDHLYMLHEFFQLEDEEGLDGFIRIQNYVFIGEEILLFILRKLKTGWTNAELCYAYFGGDDRKWSHAQTWFINRDRK